VATSNLTARNLVPNNSYLIAAQLNKIANHRADLLPAGMSIIFVNGMLNGPLDAHSSSVDISQSIRNKKVEHVFNNSFSLDSTTGKPAAVGKLVEKILEVRNICISELAHSTHGICILIIAHSHGASILESALEDQRLDSALKNSMRIITIGGAALIRSFTVQYQHKSVVNLINDFDFIPLLAHSTLKFENLQKDEELLKLINWVVDVAADMKKIFQEQVLQVRSHEKLGLADKILEDMKRKWGSTSQEPSSTTIFESLCNVIDRAAKKHLRSPNPSTGDFANFFAQAFLIDAVNLALYNIEVLTAPPSSSQEYFERFHSVQSYLSKVSQLTSDYIEDHRRSVDFSSTSENASTL
jgi:hypothetical protein